MGIQMKFIFYKHKHTKITFHYVLPKRTCGAESLGLHTTGQREAQYESINNQPKRYINLLPILGDWKKPVSKQQVM